MDNDKLQRIQAHAREIAALLYEETSPQQLTTLEGLEAAVRGHILNHVSPEIGVFLSQQSAAKAVVAPDKSKVSLEKSPSPKAKRKASKSKATLN
jgi:hypothetical protein